MMIVHHVRTLVILGCAHEDIIVMVDTDVLAVTVDVGCDCECASPDFHMELLIIDGLT